MMAWPTTSRHSRGYDSRWDKLRKVILKRDRFLCQPCLADGRPVSATQVDHIRSKANGGTDDENNLQAICAPCHKAKTARENAEAQGRKPKQRLTFDADGFPVHSGSGGRS